MTFDQWWDTTKTTATPETFAGWEHSCRQAWNAALAAQADAQPVAPDSEEERHRMQLAGISTAAFGYWKEGEPIHPDYDTVALRDVAKLYAKYADLHAAAPPARQPLTEVHVMQCFGDAVKSYAELARVQTLDFARAIERAHGIGEGE